MAQRAELARTEPRSHRAGLLSRVRHAAPVLTKICLGAKKRSASLSATRGVRLGGKSMIGRFPASEERPVPQAPERLKLNEIKVTRNGARPLVTLVLSRPLTKYEAQVVWEFFPLASASERSRKITLHAMSVPPRRARLARAVSKIPRRALALEWQHERIFLRFQAAADGSVNRSLRLAWQSAKRIIYGGEQSAKKDFDGG
jgi:hypothetical protein